MSMCGNRSPITGECILGCSGIGGCKFGREVQTFHRDPSHIGNLDLGSVSLPLFENPDGSVRIGRG